MPKPVRCLGELLLLFLFSLPYAILFVGAPYTNIDDSFYLRSADNVLRTPLNPYSSPYLCEGGDIRTTFKIIANGPFTAYYSALVKYFFGGAEAKLHLAFYLFYLIAVYSTYALARTLTGSGFLAALLFSANPYLIESSMTVGSDLPFTAFFLLSMALFVRGTNEDNRLELYGSTVMAGLAILTKYTGLLLPLMFVIYLSAVRRQLSKYLPYLSVPFLIFLLWGIHNVILYNGMHFLNQTYWVKEGTTRLYDKITSNFSNVLSGLAFIIDAQTISFFTDDPLMRLTAIGFIGLFPIAVILSYAADKNEKMRLTLAALALFLLASRLVPGKEYAVLFFVAGIYVLLKAFTNSFFEGGAQTVLVPWISALFVYNIFVAPFIAAKYGLPLFGLLAIFFSDRLHKSYDSRALFVFFASLVVLGLIYAYPIYKMGNFAKGNASRYGSLYASVDTWTCDPSYYLAERGFRFLCNETQLRFGDKIIVAGPICMTPSPLRGTLFDASHTKAGLILVDESNFSMGPYRDGRYRVFYVNDTRKMSHTE